MYRNILWTLLLLCTPALLQAQAPYGYYPGYAPYGYPPAQQQQQERTQQPQPGYNPWPQPPAYSQPQKPAATEQPRLEVHLGATRAYVQQSLVLTLDILSDSNLKSANLKLPYSGDLIFKKLSGPLASSRKLDGKQKIVNRYRYAITPIKAGRMEIPAVEANGTLSSGGQFRTVPSQPIVLDVAPAKPDMQPWLPLHGLILQAFLENDSEPEAGKPLNLVVGISAIGATGGILPSLEDQIAKGDFRVYRENSDVQGQISREGAFLVGHRTERFTLVPLFGGKVHIPELTIRWWNVDTGMAETATVPMRQLVARGAIEGADEHGITDLFPGASTLLLWLPLFGVFAVTIGFWILSWLRKKRFMQVVEEELAVILAFSLERFTALMAWISPIRRLQKVRQVFVRNLPRPFRLWFCIRLVSGEKDPEVWAYMLRFLANKHLGISANSTLPELGDRLADIHPRSNREALSVLMHQLDRVLYQGDEIQFDQWKRAFRAQLKPAPFRRGRRPLQQRPARGLPPLNPV